MAETSTFCAAATAPQKPAPGGMRHNLKENNAVVITGRLSMREDKEPQIVINRVRPMSDFSEMPEEVRPEPAHRQPEIIPNGTLYLRLPGEDAVLYPKIRAILNMFPGENGVVLYFEDTKRRRGTRCQFHESMLRELKNVLGNANIVLK